MSLDLVDSGAGRSGGLECYLAATKITQIGIIAEISALIAGVDFRHSNVSLLLLDVTVPEHPLQGIHHNSLQHNVLPMSRAGLEPATYGLKVRCSTS